MLEPDCPLSRLASLGTLPRTQVGCFRLAHRKSRISATAKIRGGRVRGRALSSRRSGFGRKRLIVPPDRREGRGAVARQLVRPREAAPARGALLVVGPLRHDVMM